MIAITGANGNLGRAIMQHLQKTTSLDKIVAIVRNDKKLADLVPTGLKIRVADYDDPGSLASALTGVTKLLQISTTSIGQQGITHELNVVQAAITQNVKHIVYTSSLDPKENACFLAARQSLHTENAIVRAGLNYTFFRNSLYMEVIPQLIGNPLNDGKIYYPGGSGRVSFVSRNDIAEALSHVLMHDGYENKTLEITGSKAYSFAELAGMLSLTKGFEFHYSDMEEMQFEKTLRTLRLPEEVVQLLISMSKGIREGEFERTESTLEDILQRKPTLLTDYLKEL